MAVAQIKPSAAPLKDLYEIGEIPPLGHVPAKNVCLGDPQGAARSAGNGDAVRGGADLADRRGRSAGLCHGRRRQLQRRLGRAWAFRSRRSTGTSIRSMSPAPTPPASSGRSAPRCKRWKVGDEVIVHCNQDDGDDEECNGGDPLLSPSQRIWGYETPDGSFAQFCRVQSRQLMKKPPHLTWEESACYTLTLATAYRMLFGHSPHTLKPGDNVLVWGASGGLGVFGVQLVAASGANAIGIVSDPIKVRICLQSRRQGRHQPQRFQVLGPDAESRHARI